MLKHLLVGCALGVTALANNPFTSLAEALQNIPSLSQYNKYFQQDANTYKVFSGAQNVTVFAISDAAISAASQTYKSKLLNNPDIARSIIRYSIVQGIHHSSEFSAKGTFLKTYQNDAYWTNVTGGQVIEAVNKAGALSVFFADRQSANIVTSDVPFNGGLIHIVDQVLEIPHNATLSAANLNVTSIVSLDKQGLMAPYQAAPDITIFALSNFAYESMGQVAASQLAQMLQSYILPGVVAYSFGFTTSGLTLKNYNNGQVVIKTGADGTLFVNDAIVEIQDILISNGVMFVIDRVISPQSAATRGRL